MTIAAEGLGGVHVLPPPVSHRLDPIGPREQCRELVEDLRRGWEAAQEPHRVIAGRVRQAEPLAEQEWPAVAELRGQQCGVRAAVFARRRRLLRHVREVGAIAHQLAAVLDEGLRDVLADQGEEHRQEHLDA